MQLLEKETAACGSFSYELGSSWAMEVGSQLGVFPIMVENIDMSGQMLIEV